MMTAESQSVHDIDLSSVTIDYVTLTIGDQLFGVPVTAIHDVFAPQSLTPVPLSSDEIAGVLNLRGRIVTAIDARRCLGMPQRSGDEMSMAIGIEKGGESYGLIIDAVGEVLTLSGEMYESNPANLDTRFANASKGVYRLEDALLVVLDVDRLLSLEQSAAA